MAHAVTPLADDVVLFHAGFHKTGTTALQSAFASHREEIAASGVLYPGSRRSHHRAALAVSQRTWGWSERGGRRIESRYWRQVVAGAQDPGRVFVSSEAFSLADDATVDRILEQLPRERMHAIFTAAPVRAAAQLVVAAVPQVRLGAALRAVARGGLQGPAEVPAQPELLEPQRPRRDRRALGAAAGRATG